MDPSLTASLVDGDAQKKLDSEESQYIALDEFMPSDEHVPDLGELGDPTKLKDLDHFRSDPPAWADFASDSLGILLAVLSMMAVANEFGTSVRGDLIKAYGEAEFERIVLALTFIPLVYVFLIILRLNNHYSLRTYTDFLKKGIVVDFPASGEAMWIVSHSIPVLFIVFTSAYSIFTAVVFTQFFASANIWILFFKQLLFDIILLWKSLQTCEDSVLTLNEFIESFADLDDDDPAVDSVTTNRAAKAVSKLRPARTRESYKAYTEKYGVVRTAQVMRLIRRWVVVLMLCGFCAAVYFYFQFEATSQDADAFDSKVNPCARVCFDRSDRDPGHCFSCVCDCVTSFGESFNVKLCLENIAVPGCTGEQACLARNGTSCG